VCHDICERTPPDALSVFFGVEAVPDTRLAIANVIPGSTTGVSYVRVSLSLLSGLQRCGGLVQAMGLGLLLDARMLVCQDSVEDDLVLCFLIELLDTSQPY